MSTFDWIIRAGWSVPVVTLLGGEAQFNAGVTDERWRGRAAVTGRSRGARRVGLCQRREGSPRGAR
jgi:hypothetical protein